MRQHLEDDIQEACYLWFSYQYPKLRKLLIAVPNGGKRFGKEGARLTKAGVTAGVADLILFVPNNQYPALCIEMKSKDGKQRPSQKEWQELVEKQGYRYVICRSLDDFMKEINIYLFSDILM
jgi:hypothetical protein